MQAEALRVPQPASEPDHGVCTVRQNTCVLQVAASVLNKHS